MAPRITHWIDGTRTDGTSGRTGPVFNPATGLPSAEVDLASAAEVDVAAPCCSSPSRLSTCPQPRELVEEATEAAVRNYR